MLAAFDCVVTRLGLTRQAMMRTLLDGFLSDKIRALKERDEILAQLGSDMNAEGMVRIDFALLFVNGSEGDALNHWDSERLC